MSKCPVTYLAGYVGRGGDRCSLLSNFSCATSVRACREITACSTRRPMFVDQAEACCFSLGLCPSNRVAYLGLKLVVSEYAAAHEGVLAVTAVCTSASEGPYAEEGWNRIFP